MGRKQKLILGFALMQILAVCQVSVGKARVDDHLIGFVSEKPGRGNVPSKVKVK